MNKTTSKARTMDEYRGLIDEALMELSELRASIEYDEEFMGGGFAFIDDLEHGVKQLKVSIEEGAYTFGKNRLGFMTIVQNANSALLPFKFLFTRINETHEKGLTEDE